MFKKTTLTLATMSMFAAGAASAFPAKVDGAGDLLRGPGEDYDVAISIPAGAQVDVDGCLDGATWCQAEYMGTIGWMPAANVGIDTAKVQTLTVVDTHNSEKGAVAGAVMAGAAASIVGTPVAGILAATAVGGVAGGAVTPPKAEVISYVESHPVEPVFLGGEVKTGMAVPADIEVIPVPDADFAYLNVNGETVIVTPDSKEIVYVVN
ncbi:hypothetical protein BFP70_08160 [Thioclava sp. SK-1]|uniref:DUF1236 domain-containing protein n=1 Tax=Thioclava sp. SK-1 TaxID=1889770 RepID=UPI0008263D80|nr:DUF1236 domain-containing protein [Thioclava sp. SK-1]OCX66077.1 hypothetical protein BFP70_08160 [Thioclava sp. SK-1]